MVIDLGCGDGIIVATAAQKFGAQAVGIDIVKSKGFSTTAVADDVRAAVEGNVLLAKLEGNNPAGSVKDRPAISMIRGAEERGEISPGDTLLEATSGNTGIGLAMAAAISGYPLVIVMPESASTERIQTMKAYGADLVLTSADGGMEEARDVVTRMEREGRGRVLDQFGNPDNPRAHENGTGPELWRQTDGRITHFVSAMGTTGTITGVSRFLKSRNPGVQIVGAQPAEGAKIPGIRAWPPEYVPKIFDPSAVDRTVEVAQADAEEMAARIRAADPAALDHLVAESVRFWEKPGVDRGAASALLLRRVHPYTDTVRQQQVVGDRGDLLGRAPCELEPLELTIERATLLPPRLEPLLDDLGDVLVIPEVDGLHATRRGAGAPAAHRRGTHLGARRRGVPPT